MSDEQEQEAQELIPTVQDTIIFNGKPLVVVRLPDENGTIARNMKQWKRGMNGAI
ncbi:MAG TPA: hypothetical protein VNG51_10795 [Ktedonobacteraceae bacterium]|nr:hypothetical protein [Ktedonobacteraceae bacterium]